MQFWTVNEIEQHAMADSIHHVVAGPEGCRLSDVFTHFRPEARSHGLEWDEQPVEKDGDTYEVAWKS